MTPEQLKIKKDTCIPPEGGWKPGVYLVEVAYSSSNVIHRAILALYTIHSKPDELLLETFHGGVWTEKDAIDHPNNWIHGSYDAALSVGETYYLKALRLLLSDEEFSHIGPTKS